MCLWTYYLILGARHLLSLLYKLIILSFNSRNHFYFKKFILSMFLFISTCKLCQPKVEFFRLHFLVSYRAALLDWRLQERGFSIRARPLAEAVTIPVINKGLRRDNSTVYIVSVIRIADRAAVFDIGAFQPRFAIHIPHHGAGTGRRQTTASERIVNCLFAHCFTPFLQKAAQ